MWRAQGVKTVFEKQVKGNVFELEGDKCQLQLPADDKKDMHLTMGILVIQGMVSSTFSLQLRVRDVKNDQHRVHLSTSVRFLPFLRNNFKSNRWRVMHAEASPPLIPCNTVLRCLALTARCITRACPCPSSSATRG